MTKELLLLSIIGIEENNNNENKKLMDAIIPVQW